MQYSVLSRQNLLQGARSLSGELPAAVAAAAEAAAAAEEKPVLSILDKIRGKRRTSAESASTPKGTAHRLSLDGGTQGSVAHSAAHSLTGRHCHV